MLPHLAVRLQDLANSVDHRLEEDWMDDRTKRIALITGANKGIGLEVARALGKAGLTILMGARNPELGRAAAAVLAAEALDARFVELDVTNPRTIESAVALVASELGRLDVLVNNAGINAPGDGPPGAADLDAVRQVIETNFLGAAAVTQAMLPMLRKSAAGRIVNVSSGLGSLTWNADPNWEFAPVKLLGYCASKAAMNMLTVQLAWELRDTPIKVNSSDPGYTATDLNGNSGYQTVAEGAAETIRLALLPADGPSGGYFATSGPDPW
jgi:NAD(P)-dependent dehydrogenase (short-subunit alcohol dehydrogenase family)